MARKQIIQVCTEAKKCRNQKIHVHSSAQVQLDKDTFFQLMANGERVASDRAKLFFIALHLHSHFRCLKTFQIFSVLNTARAGNLWVNESRAVSSVTLKPFLYAFISSFNTTGEIHTTDCILKQKREASIKISSRKEQFCLHQARLITCN